MLIKADACMKYYDANKPLETDVSGVGLGAAILQTWDVMTFQTDAVPDNTILLLTLHSSVINKSLLLFILEVLSCSKVSG